MYSANIEALNENVIIPYELNTKFGEPMLICMGDESLNQKRHGIRIHVVSKVFSGHLDKIGDLLTHNVVLLDVVKYIPGPTYMDLSKYNVPVSRGDVSINSMFHLDSTSDKLDKIQNTVDNIYRTVRRNENSIREINTVNPKRYVSPRELQDVKLSLKRVYTDIGSTYKNFNV